MKTNNFVNGVGRKDIHSPNTLPTDIDVSKVIPSKVTDLIDDPWRSLAAMVRI